MDWVKLPPLTALRAFAALAETRSVTKAGAQLNVSHAAISQQIRALEAHMGLMLVDRSRRQLDLTAEGQRLADALISGFGEIARSVETLTGADAGRILQVSATPSFAAYWLMPRLSELREIYPDMDIMIDPSPKVVPLEPGGIDVAIRYGTGHWPGLEAQLLLRTGIVAVAAPSLIKGRKVRDPADLVDLPWLQEFGTTEASDWLRRRGVTKERSGGLTQVPGTLLLDGLRSGQGVAVTVHEWVRDDLATGRLQELFCEKGQSGYYLVTRPGVMRPPLRAFVRWILSQAKTSDT